MRILTLIFLLPGFMIGCSRLETVENKDDSGKLIEKYSRRKDTYAKQGKYTAYFSNGKVSEESWYENDTLHGERRLFYETGNLQSTEHLVNGIYEGKYQKFYENGQLSNDGEYVNNEMSGIWKRWYDTGEIWEEVSFAHNEENGPYKIYQKNGKLEVEGTYLNGDNDHGEVKKYDENGELVQKMYCEEGICMTSWTKEKGDVPVDTARMRQLVELKKSAIDTDNE